MSLAILIRTLSKLAQDQAEELPTTLTSLRRFPCSSRTECASLGCAGAEANLQKIVNTITMPMRYIVLLFLLYQVIFPANAQARSRIALAAEFASLFDASES